MSPQLSYPSGSVQAMLDANHVDRLVQRCRELVDIPSVSHDEAAANAYVRAALLSSFDVTYDHDTVLYAGPPRRSGTPLVVLVGHTDTVPIDDNLPSSLSDGVIHGRGTSDMKGGIAVMLELANWIAAGPEGQRYDVGFLFFGREELPAAECPLLPALREPDGIPRADLAILMEPTANALEAGCQGNLNLTLRFDGVAAHSARPWAGTNAAHVAIDALRGFVQAAPREVEVGGLAFREAANIVGLRGGTARNVLPAQVEVDINIRYAPDTSAADAESHWIKQFESDGAHVTVVGNAPPAPVVTDHPIVHALRGAGAGAPIPKVAWTNASDFGQCGIPAINFGPGDPVFAHRKDEQIDVAALERSLTILQALFLGASA
jgi:succinyl-diaminopimelate desuccinylase